MIYQLPLRDDATPHYRFETELDLTTYTFEFHWNERASAWFLTIKDVDGVVLLAGVRVVLGAELLRPYKNPLLPPGRLEAIDTTGEDEEPTLEDLGRRVLLLYADATHGRRR